MSSRLKTWGAQGVALLLALLAIQGLRAQAMGHFLATQRYEDVYYLPPPVWLKRFSLGYRETLASLLWMRSLVYFGQELQHNGQVRYVFDYAEAMVSLDPDFKAAYLWIGSASIYRTGTVTVDDVRKSIRFLERGAKRFPGDGDIAWSLGATYAYELAPMLKTAAERQEAHRIATEHLVVAARLGAGPAWLVLTNATQMIRLGQMEQAIHHLEEMYATVQDADTREQIRLQLAHLRDQSFAEAFRAAVRQAEARRKRTYPYVDSGLFMLLGDRPPITSAALVRTHFGAVPDALDDVEEAP